MDLSSTFLTIRVKRFKFLHRIFEKFHFRDEYKTASSHNFVDFCFSKIVDFPSIDHDSDKSLKTWRTTWCKATLKLELQQTKKLRRLANTWREQWPRDRQEVKMVCLGSVNQLQVFHNFVWYVRFSVVLELKILTALVFARENTQRTRSLALIKSMNDC